MILTLARKWWIIHLQIFKIQLFGQCKSGDYYADDQLIHGNKEERVGRQQLKDGAFADS